VKHFVCFPSADTSRGVKCAGKWSDAGYRVLVMVDPPKAILSTDPNINMMAGPDVFPGYYRCVNKIVARAFELGADLITCIGDDQDPPEQGADFMAARYFEKFPEGDGVMQPCGDPQGEVMVVKGFEHLGPLHNAGRICGSPVFGKKWADTGYLAGAFCDAYRSFYSDEDLWNVAQKRGKLWLDKETQHFHRHWSFANGMPHQAYHTKAQANWEADQKLFFERQKAGFPE
jgi:hypothetical protein